jgi:hypothetical protein
VAQTGVKPTTIICKYFLEALDKEIYGWFWVCPGGEIKEGVNKYN